MYEWVSWPQEKHDMFVLMYLEAASCSAIPHGWESGYTTLGNYGAASAEEVYCRADGSGI